MKATYVYQNTRIKQKVKKGSNTLTISLVAIAKFATTDSHNRADGQVLRNWSPRQQVSQSRILTRGNVQASDSARQRILAIDAGPRVLRLPLRPDLVHHAVVQPEGRVCGAREDVGTGGTQSL